MLRRGWHAAKPVVMPLRASRRHGAIAERSSAYLGHPFLRQGAGLLDSEFAVQAQGGFAALARVRAVLEHEHLAARWRNLAHKTRYGAQEPHRGQQSGKHVRFRNAPAYAELA